MKTLILTICSLFVCASTYAGSFADADFFGGTNGSGNPNGILLDSGGRVVIDTSFNFVFADGTNSFTIGSPYDSSVQGTYSSALGYIPGTIIDPASLVFTFFLRDPNGGNESERLNINFGDLVFNGSSFSGTLVTSFGGNALLVGDIQTNGFVMYRVRALSGDFILDAAYAQFTTSVPEGGSAAALLGIALIGAEVARRRLRTA